jgi:magnesium transporter
VLVVRPAAAGRREKVRLGPDRSEAGVLFLTEILGAEVIDVGQRSVGRVRDVTVRVEEPYPVVTGLILSRRRELVIPWTAVRTFAAATREVALRQTREELERQHAPSHDIWLGRDVLDKQIVDTDGRRVVRVNDLQLSDFGGQLLLVGADIGLRGILRRLGIESMVKAAAHLLRRELPMALVSWDVVGRLGPGERPAGAANGNGDALRLRIPAGRLAKLHPADIADIVEDLGAQDRRAVFDSLTGEVAADTLEEMELDDQVSVVEHMANERASEILGEMPPDEVADILAELPQERAQEILGRMDREDATQVEELLTYREDTAGGLMTKELATVTEDMTVAGCIETLRQHESESESYYMFVVDEDGHLRGVVSLRDLVVAPGTTPVGDIMVQDVVSVRATEGVQEVAAVLAKYNLVAVPVVDDSYHLLGMVTVDDALDAVLPDTVKRKLPKAV